MNPPAFTQVLVKIKPLLKRAFIFYAFLFLLAAVLVNHDRIRFGYKIRILDTLMPVSFNYLLDHMIDQKYAPSDLRPFTSFYKKVTDFFPNEADAWGMLGFCHFYEGRTKEAVDDYQKAVELEPKFFWFYHNLGVVYFKQGEYLKAIDVTKQGLRRNPQDSLQFIASSTVIYRSLLLSLKNQNINLTKRMEQGYRNSYKMLILSYYELKDFHEMLRIADIVTRMEVEGKDEFYYYAGVAAYELKAYEQAKQYLEISIKLNSTVQANSFLALSLQGLGQKEKANTILKRIKPFKDNEINFIVNVNDITLMIL